MIKRRNTIILVLIVLLVTTICYTLIQFNFAKNIKENCLTNDFYEVFEKENNVKLDEVYDFSKILNCKSWDEMIIVGGSRVNRAAIFLKEGVALPPICYSERAQGELVFFLIKDKKLVSPLLSFYHLDFLYFGDLNYFDYVRLDREDAIFKCVKLEPVELQDGILTFKLIGNSKKE